MATTPSSDVSSDQVMSGPYAGETFGPVVLPARYPDNEAFLGVFGADLDRVRLLLPSKDLRPVRLAKNRAAVAVLAALYNRFIVDEVDGRTAALSSYGEVGIGIMCTAEPAPPYLPLSGLAVRDSWQPGVFIVHLPVTTRQAWEAGRVVYNAPKFVADMHFMIGPERCAVLLSERAQQIFRFEARRGRVARRDRNDLVFYTSKDGHLLKSRAEVDAIQQLRFGRRAGSLDLGDHPIADELRALDLDVHPIAVRTYLRHSAILHGPRIVGSAEPYDGWLREREPRRGELAVSYPGLPPINVYDITVEAGGVLAETAR